MNCINSCDIIKRCDFHLQVCVYLQTWLSVVRVITPQVAQVYRLQRLYQGLLPL